MPGGFPGPAGEVEIPNWLAYYFITLLDYIERKISAKLGMFRKAYKIILRKSCLTPYNAMILPVFHYCAVVWDSCDKTDREYL